MRVQQFLSIEDTPAALPDSFASGRTIKLHLATVALTGVLVLTGCSRTPSESPTETSLSKDSSNTAPSLSSASLSMAETCAQSAGTRGEPGVVYRTHAFMVVLAMPGSRLDVSEARALRAELQALELKADPTLKADIEGVGDPLDQIVDTVQSHGAGAVTTENDRYNDSWARLVLACPQLDR